MLMMSSQLQAHAAITGRYKLPWRYRWPESVRDDVLARLLALNAERYADEMALGLHSNAGMQAARRAGPLTGWSGARFPGCCRGHRPAS